MRTRIATLTLFFLPGCLTLSAQTEAVSARLTGSVIDPDGKPAPQAKVTLANPEVGFTRAFLTDGEGAYIFSAVPPGRYQLKVQKEGFATYLQPEVVLTVGQSTSLNPKLELGALNQVIEVTTDAPLLNTGNANIGAEVAAKQVVELPLNIRNVYNLVQLSSGVNNNTQYQGLT
jgi:hypothetical protein